VLGHTALALAFAIASGMSVYAAEGQPYPGTAEYHLAPRNALVIGVSSLKDKNGFIDLKNPSNDALRVSDALRTAGFAVIDLNERLKPNELTRQNIKLALYDFARILQSEGGVGVIYFSGHGIEREGQMYLAPYDAYVLFERDLDEELIPLQLLYDAIAYAKNPLNIIVLDACRDNPWSKPLEQFGPRRPLAATPASENVILANSTLSGGKALDGSEDLSPYAAAFISSLSQEDAGLTDFFGSITTSLYELRSKFPSIAMPTLLQAPGREFVFVPTVVTYNREQRAYQIGKEKGSRELLRQLTWKYSAGYFYKAAKDWLENARLAPTSSLPTSVIQIQGSGELRAACSAFIVGGELRVCPRIS
jgi:hypothetical protein